MVRIVTVIKNSILFLLFSLPGYIGYVLLKSYSDDWTYLARVNYSYNSPEYQTYALNALIYNALAIGILAFFVTFPLFYFLSNTIEESLIEY